MLKPQILASQLSSHFPTMYFWLFGANFLDFINLYQKGFTAKSIPENNSLVTLCCSFCSQRCSGKKKNPQAQKNLLPGSWPKLERDGHLNKGREPDPLTKMPASLSKSLQINGIYTLKNLCTHLFHTEHGFRHWGYSCEQGRQMSPPTLWSLHSSRKRREQKWRYLK